MNPYLDDNNNPNELLDYTLAYYGITLDEFKSMSDDQVTGMVKRFDDILNDGVVRTASYRKGNRTPYNDSMTFNAKGRLNNGNVAEGAGYIDSVDSFSKFFSLDSWWDERIKKLPESVQKTFPFIIVPKASKSEKNKGCEGGEYQDTNDFMKNGSEWRVDKRHPEGGYAVINKKTTNAHPCVKPVKLFSYLITLGSREGDLILDPFVGSGTSCVSAKILNRHYIGIEQEAEYVTIANKRIEAEESQLRLF